jgi:hypothetical protein
MKLAENEAHRIAALVDSGEFAKALYVLRDALARAPRHPKLLAVAEKLAEAAESKARVYGSNKATEYSRKAQEVAVIAHEARDYLTA